MNLTTFDIEKARAIEIAVCGEFECDVADIKKFQDTLFKKVVVFISSKLFNADKRVLAKMYQITYLYIPTVIMEIEILAKRNVAFDGKLNSILKKLYNEC